MCGLWCLINIKIDFSKRKLVVNKIYSAYNATNETFSTPEAFIAPAFIWIRRTRKYELSDKEAAGHLDLLK